MVSRVHSFRRILESVVKVVNKEGHISTSQSIMVPDLNDVVRGSCLAMSGQTLVLDVTTGGVLVASSG